MSSAGGSADPTLTRGERIEEGRYDGQSGGGMTAPLNQPPPAQDAGGDLGKKRQTGGWKRQAESIMIYLLAPVIVFSLVACGFSLLGFNYIALAWILDVIALISAGALLYLWAYKAEGAFYMIVAVLMLMATAAGTGVGLWLDASFMSQYWAYSKLVTYTNVLPTEPANAHQDAGLMSFSESTRVDTRRSLGRRAQDGYTYCVAPILDETQATKVEYWAVGVNCCESLWNFMCDDALASGARAGIVKMKPKNGIKAGPDYNLYLEAIKQSTAVYDLMSAENPLLVQWVVDPVVIKEELFRNGWVYLGFAILIYAVWSLLLAVVLHLLVSGMNK
eukprot:gnl/TRDRNA2_/TRDRNA2_182789_c0_seq1.p1 gnl/TRDRNA2_/TRDRNA2_182789_c0~~gnl/TRDRNA2_/TRDRNA2_182789_c0_seq1.p1  ORF type:complete len:333 (+),score=42.33 gnl/TRDRNA2_/TRDRNA2_182789_c0_seq1:87-1085(+)